MSHETPSLTPESETIHLEWPAEFSPEEIRILEEAAGIHNTRQRLGHMGMADTVNSLEEVENKIWEEAETIFKNKKSDLQDLHTLEDLIESVQAKAEENYQAVA